MLHDIPLLNLTPAAKTDVQEIWRYTVASWGTAQAERYISAVRQACHDLIDQPLLGKALPQVHHELRIFRCQHHFILYLTDAAGLTFVAFLHERMDIVSRLFERLE